jgi:hypothetical protein
MPSRHRHGLTLDLFGTHFPWGRWLNLVCFFSFLLSSEGIGPVAITWLATLDGTHGVVVSRGPDGHTNVTLTHRSNKEAEAPHGRLLKSLLLFSKPEDLPQRDHLLYFSSLDDGRCRIRPLAGQIGCIQVTHQRQETFWCFSHQAERCRPARLPCILSAHGRRWAACGMVMLC